MINEDIIDKYRESTQYHKILDLSCVFEMTIILLDPESSTG